MAVEMEVVYEGNLGCTGRHGPSKADVVTQAPLDNGGKGDSFSPTDLLATALGSCMLTIMGIAGKKENLDIKDTRIQVSKEMVADPLRRIGRLTVRVDVVTSEALTSRQKSVLENAAITCPVAQSIHPDIEVPTEFSYRLR